MGRAAAGSRSNPNRIADPNAATPRAGKCNRQALQLFELLACNVKTFLLGDLKGDILFCEREYPPLPAPLRVRRDSRFVLTNNFSHGMLTTTKGSEKEAFSFHPLKRGDGRCKSLRNGKGGAFEPRGGNAAPVPPLQGNEVPRIQRGIQVEPRTIALFALSLLFIGSGRFLSPEPDIERRNSP